MVTGRYTWFAYGGSGRTLGSPFSSRVLSSSVRVSVCLRSRAPWWQLLFVERKKQKSVSIDSRVETSESGRKRSVSGKIWGRSCVTWGAYVGPRSVSAKQFRPGGILVAKSHDLNLLCVHASSRSEISSSVISEDAIVNSLSMDVWNVSRIGLPILEGTYGRHLVFGDATPMCSSRQTIHSNYG
jgi:hypothetical protein